MLHDLYTPEGETLQSAPWDVYPRPQLKRKSYVNLNGIWEFGIGTNSFLSTMTKPFLFLFVRRAFCPASMSIFRKGALWPTAANSVSQTVF